MRPSQEPTSIDEHEQEQADLTPEEIQALDRIRGRATPAAGRPQLFWPL